MDIIINGGGASITPRYIPLDSGGPCPKYQVPPPLPPPTPVPPAGCKQYYWGG